LAAAAPPELVPFFTNERTNDFARHFVLQRPRIAARLVETLRPDVFAALCFNELRKNAYPISLLSDTAL
jgi:hypothetical protein